MKTFNLSLVTLIIMSGLGISTGTLHSQSTKLFSLLPKGRLVGTHFIRYPDSSWIAENLKVIDSNFVVIPVFDMSTVHWKSETDLYLFNGDSLISLSDLIKKGRRGQLSYRTVNAKHMIMVFDVFLPNIDSVAIHSDSPGYDRLYSYSEIWAFSRTGSKVELLDKDEGEIEHITLTSRALRFDVRGKYKKEIYFR